MSAVLSLCVISFAEEGEVTAIDPMLQEFLDIAETLESSNYYPYFINSNRIAAAEQRLAEIKAELALPPEQLTPKVGENFQISISQMKQKHEILTRELAELLIYLTDTQFIMGDVNKAISLAEEAATYISSEYLNDFTRLALEVSRGTAYLRQAEVENCIEGNNADCCVFPLGGGGLHSLETGAEKARESFLRVLEMEPNDMRSKWLLNILAMALGTYPDSVDPEYQIPPSALESEYDIGHFHNVAAVAGVDYFGLAGGVVTLDYDRDGYLDIVASSWGLRDPLQLFRNNGDGTFSNKSAESGLANQLGGLQVITTDYNNDGYEDLFVLRGAWYGDFGEIRNSLLRNNGDGTFTDVTHDAGLANPAYPTQAAVWGDFNNDGHLDLFIGNEGFPGWRDYPCQLFANNGDGTFTDVALFSIGNLITFVKGVSAGDYDNDGHLDIFVSTGYGKNLLLRNNGNGTFNNVAATALVTGEGTYEQANSVDFPAWFFDYDNDGWLDIFVAPFATTVEDTYQHYMGIPNDFRKVQLYRNNQDGTFTDKTAELNLNGPYEVMGASFGDLDNDGWLDILLTTGDPSFTAIIPNIMLRNNAGTGFQDVTFSGGFGNLQKGHGVSFADYNNNGTQDIYHVLGGAYDSDRYYNALYANPGHGNRFLHLSLVGVSSNRLAVGTRVKVTINTPNGAREIHRAAGSMSSFGHTPSRMEIGLGNATSIEEVEVWWPKTGERQKFTQAPLDSWLEITEGQGSFVQKPLIPFSFDTTQKAAEGFLKVQTP